MKRSPIWDQLAHTPVLDVIAVPHVHEKRRPNGQCAKAHSLIAGADVHGVRLHLFHDDQNRLYVVKLPSG